MKEVPLFFSAPMVRANHAGRKRMTRRVVALDRLKVVMRREVRSDLPAFIRPTLVVPKAAKLPATLTPYGAVSCLINGRELGLKPGEFDFVCPYAQGKTVLIVEGGRNTWTILPHESRVWVRETWRIAAWRDNPCRVACDYKASPEETHTPWIEMESQEWKVRVAQIYAELRKMAYPSQGGSYQWEHGQAPLKWHPSIHMPRWASRGMYPVTSVRLERLHSITEEDAIAEGVEPVDRDPEGDILYRDYLDEGYAWSAKDSFISLWYTLYGFKSAYAWDKNPWVWVIEYNNPLWRN